MLCALLAFSFVSCEKDKSGDMITNYENFAVALRGGLNTYYLFYKALDDVSEEVNVNLEGIHVYDADDFVENYLANKNIYFDDSGINFTAGTITGTKNDTTKNYTFTNAKFNVKYTEGEGSEEKELEFTINGTYDESEDEEANTESFAYNFTANDKTYNISYTLSANPERFTSAKVNGNNVELRLLNAMFSWGF